MNREALIDLLTFIFIGLEAFWALTDPRSKQDQIKSFLKPKIVLYGIFAFLFLVLNYASGMFFPLPDSGFDELLSLFGVLIFGLGIIISVWAKVTMGKIWGIPSEMRRDQTKLIKTGPFHYSRNPIYVGLVMVLAGYGLALQSYFTFLALIPLLYFMNAAEKEEKLLEKHFGKEYLEYKKNVPRFF